MTPIDPVHPKLGFIGIGSMGRPIARRLLQAGYKVMVYNRDRRKAEALVECGATVAKRISQLAFDADVILSCLPTDDAVRSVYAGPEGVFANVRPGSVIVEMSTVNPEISRELYKLGTACAVGVLDVPISGSTLAAEQGTLTLLGGGDEEVFHNAEPIFRAISQQNFYLGPSGSGTTMKLVVNTLLGVGMQAVAEAVAFGEKAGLNRDRLLDVLSHSGHRSGTRWKAQEGRGKRLQPTICHGAHEQGLLLDSGSGCGASDFDACDGRGVSNQHPGSCR